MEQMELDEIDRLISKGTWERFQRDMDKMEYQRRNCDLEHRIKILHLQLKIPKVTISNKIPCQYRVDHKKLQLQLRNTFEFQELKREKIIAIENNYQRHVHDIHANSNEIIRMFENLMTVKKKRYYENEMLSVRQEINHLENCIALSKQQLNEIRNNHGHFVHSFVLQAVVHWKSSTVLNDQIQNNSQRFNELCKEIDIKRQDVTKMQNNVTELQKVYEQIKSDKELINSQIPRTIPKLPINYYFSEQDSGITGSPVSDSSVCSGVDSNRIIIIENIVIKSGNSIVQSNSTNKLKEGQNHLDAKIHSQRDNVPTRVDSIEVEVKENKSRGSKKIEKIKMDSSDVVMDEIHLKEIKVTEKFVHPIHSQRDNAPTRLDSIEVEVKENKSRGSKEIEKIKMDSGDVVMDKIHLKETEKLNMSMDFMDVEMDEDKSNEIKQTEKLKISNKLNNKMDDKSISSREKGSIRKKSNMTSDRKTSTGKTVEFNLVSSGSPRKLRNRKIIPDANQLSQKKSSQPNKREELPQTRKKISPKYFDVPEVYNFPSKESSFTIPGADVSLLENFQQNQSNVDSFILDTSDRASRHSTTDDDFFITNECGGFDFFQDNNDKDQLFSM